MAVVSPTDRPKSVRNRCLIELFVAFFVLSLCPFDIPCGIPCILMRNNFPKRPSGAPLHTLSKLYDGPVGFVNPPYFEAEYCLFCGRRRVAVARYRMICIVSVGIGTFVIGLGQISSFFSSS